jgi:hypothetical protein
MASCDLFMVLVRVYLYEAIMKASMHVYSSYMGELQLVFRVMADWALRDVHRLL